MNYKVTEVISAGNVQTQYGIKVKSTIRVEGWEGDVDYWGQTFVGDTLEGSISPAKDPKYNPTLKKTPAPRANSSHSATQNTKNEAMYEAMGRKEMSVNSAMDRKEQAIAHAGSVTNATNLVISILQSNIWANKSEQMVKDKVREYIAWYHTLYEHPNDIPSNPDNVPF